MVSNAPYSNALPSSTAESRPQAGPLPSKRGEIGYQENAQSPQENGNTVEPSLPTRHPADRDPVPSANGAASSNSQPSSDASSTRKKMRHTYKVGGIYLSTLFRCAVQVLLIGGTIAAWVIVIRRLSQHNTTPPPDPNSDDPNPSNNFGLSGNTGTVFVYVAFGIATLSQLLFLERCVYLMRAQRYMFLHPGEILPRHGRSRAGGDLSMPFNPWNRAPLPTYAAALALSGHGTGDVEDNVIAIPPPPAYGQIRGSTLLLAGYLRNSLRRGVPSVVVEQNRNSQAISRPVSYMSRDGDWEERLDAERARRLEETLARLEEGSNSSQSHAPMAH